MMTVANKELYQRYRAEKASRTSGKAAWQDLLLAMLLFGGMGAITWAIRGTGGWNGVDGTIVPGLTWGILWYYLCYRRGIDARNVILWLGLGLAVGGELGYGQYVSWIRGMFEMPEGRIGIAPWQGYIWLAICGIGWAAPGGIALGWTLSQKHTLRDWQLRLALFIVLILLALGPFVTLFSKLFLQVCPSLFFPHYGTGIYEGVVHKYQARTLYTNTQNIAFLLWWVAALLVAAWRKDRATLTVGAIIGGAFGLGFMLSTIWCLGYSYAPAYIDWWKMWELAAGFSLGLPYAVALWWAIRQVDKTHDPNGVPLPATALDAVSSAQAEQRQSRVSLPFVCLILLFTFLDGFILTALLLAAFYAGSLHFVARTGADNNAAEKRGRISLYFSIFLLLFILFRGATYKVGGLLGLYDTTITGQYNWPMARTILFTPILILLIVPTLIQMWKVARAPQGKLPNPPTPDLIGVRMADLMTGIAAIGAATIWPAKIGVLYAVCLCVSIFALNRLNRSFDKYVPDNEERTERH